MRMNAPAITPRSSLLALRIVVGLLAPTMALAIGAASVGRAGQANVVATSAWGVAVAAIVLAVVVPGPLGLTVIRLLLPATVPAAVAALVAGAGAWGVVALAAALSATLVAFSAEAAEAFVQASAYGHERRLPLRAPAAVLLPMGLSWSVWCAATLGAIVLLAAQRVVVGGPLLAAAAALTWLLARRFHRFSQRWLVLVPAGVVIHDPVVLGETLMLQRPNVAFARLATADTQAADFTGPAAGHAIELTVREMVLALLAVTPSEPKGKALHVQSLLVAPSRPGRALQAMADAKVPVG
jgi:hypothetical protein